MAVTLNASTSSGLVQTADTSGTIELQNNGTTRLTVNSSGATIPTATVTTLNAPSGVLATQNGMTGIAKAWVNFDGTTSSPSTIRGSFNVGSVTKNGTGDYTINFTTAMPNTNYVVSGAARYGDGGVAGTMRVVSICSVGTLANAMQTSSVRVATQYTNAAGGQDDVQVVCVTVISS